MRHRVLFLLLLCISVFGGCSSLPFDSSEDNSWPADLRGNIKGTVRIVSVSADKAGDWLSLEKEINGLLPLLFYEESLLVVPAGVKADYAAEVTVREREFPDGWQTRRSLSAEVRLWAGEDTGAEMLPLSAGRSLVQGKQSLASSKTLSAMLRKALRNAVNGLSG